MSQTPARASSPVPSDTGQARTVPPDTGQTRTVPSDTLPPGAADPARRPNVFVVGDAKCGTTSLHRLFELAPGIGTTRRKELHFFSAPEIMARANGPGDEGVAEEIVTQEADYLAEFARSLGPRPPGVVVDVSPSYLQAEGAAARIADFAPEAQILITLREPAAKVFSQYVHLWSEGRETLPFAEAYAASAPRRAQGWSTMFDYAAGGYYAAAVARYLEAFGRERVCIVLFEELVGDWDGTRDRLARFLGAELPPGPLPQMNSGGRMRSPLAQAVFGNAALRGAAQRLLPLGLRTALSQRLRGAVAVDKPELEPAMRADLRARYAADVAALETLIGRPTGWPAA